MEKHTSIQKYIVVYIRVCGGGSAGALLRAYMWSHTGVIANKAVETVNNTVCGAYNSK